MSAARPPGAWSVDTSVAVASVDPSHEAHDACRQVAIERRPALSGHAAYETYSVLTRLPGAGRVEPATASELLERAFPERCWLTGKQQDQLLRRLAPMGLVGGMAYDALVAEASRLSDRVLLTRDRRAIRTYEAIGVAFELV